MASSMANPENENSVKKQKRSQDQDRDREQQEQQQEQHKKTIFDWYEPNDIHTRLWHVPNTPIQPSFIDFLIYCASVKLKQSELDIQNISISSSSSISSR